MSGLPGYDMHKDDLLRRLRRIEGQVRGLAQDGRGGPVLHRRPHPALRLTKALQSVALGMFDDHLRHWCR